MSSPFSLPLYDEGEEAWPTNTKIHAGCGGIYLTGYTNVDIVGSLAHENPSLVDANSTEVRKYYARLAGTAVALPKRRATVVDVQADLLSWLPTEHSWRKVIALQVLGHFTPRQAIRILSRWCSHLYHQGGVLVLSVPDMAGTLRMLREGSVAEREFAVRHLEGSGRDEYNWHKAWYTQDSLGEALSASGFTRQEWLPNIHIYPALCVRTHP